MFITFEHTLTSKFSKKVSMSKQLKKDIGQLRKLDFDLANYFSNTIIPQLFVDADMVLRIFKWHSFLCPMMILVKKLNT